MTPFYVYAIAHQYNANSDDPDGAQTAFHIGQIYPVAVLIRDVRKVGHWIPTPTTNYFGMTSPTSHPLWFCDEAAPQLFQKDRWCRFQTQHWNPMKLQQNGHVQPPKKCTPLPSVEPPGLGTSWNHVLGSRWNTAPRWRCDFVPPSPRGGATWCAKYGWTREKRQVLLNQSCQSGKWTRIWRFCFEGWWRWRGFSATPFTRFFTAPAKPFLALLHLKGPFTRHVSHFLDSHWKCEQNETCETLRNPSIWRSGESMPGMLQQIEQLGDGWWIITMFNRQTIRISINGPFCIANCKITRWQLPNKSPFVVCSSGEIPSNHYVMRLKHYQWWFNRDEPWF